VNFAKIFAFFALKSIRKVKRRDIASWIGRKRKVRREKAAKDAERESRGSVFVNFAKIFAFFAFPINVESAIERRCSFGWLKTQSSQSEAAKDAKGESRGSVFVNFAKRLCVLRVEINSESEKDKTLRLGSAGNARFAEGSPQRTQRLRKRLGFCGAKSAKPMASI